MTRHICKVMKSLKIAAQIKKIRQEKGLTQERLAEMAGLSVGHVIRLEGRRKTNPTMATLKKISKALGISLDVFMNFEEKVDAKTYGNQSTLL